MHELLFVIKRKQFLKARDMWNNCMAMSLHRGRNQWGSHHERDWAKDDLICRRVVWSRLAVSWSHPDSSRPVTEVRNSCINVGDHVRSKFRTYIVRNVETVMFLLLFKELTSCRLRACTGRVDPLTRSIPVGLQCTGNLWQVECKLDVFCRGYQLVLCYWRGTERQQKMLLQHTELFARAICCNNLATFWDRRFCARQLQVR
jgi:hypothetical protein